MSLRALPILIFPLHPPAIPFNSRLFMFICLRCAPFPSPNISSQPLSHIFPACLKGIMEPFIQSSIPSHHRCTTIHPTYIILICPT